MGAVSAKRVDPSVWSDMSTEPKHPVQCRIHYRAKTRDSARTAVRISLKRLFRKAVILIDVIDYERVYGCEFLQTSHGEHLCKGQRTVAFRPCRNLEQKLPKYMQLQ
jgi:hypothetical protein